jgi:site-specific recombinase XerD
MEADLKIANYSAVTRECYLRCAARFAAYHGRSPAEMGRDEVREWLVHLIEDRQLGPEAVKQGRTAVLFLYRVTLGQDLNLESIPVPRKQKRIPAVLSGREVQQLLDLIDKPKYRAIVMSMYGGGLRIAEACGLRPEHIDSKRMLLGFVGKGNKERCTLLSERLLSYLRDYWRLTRPTNGWMFPGQGNRGHITRRSVARVLAQVVKTAGINKHVTTHTLRHSFATHLVEMGTDVSVVKALLGHSRLRSTEVYLHTSRALLARTKSPLDLLGTPAASVLG